MKTVNSISGGKTSAYIAVHYPADYEVFSLVCIDDKNCKPKDTLINTYVNLKLEKFAPEYGEFIATAEDDKTLYAMMDLEQILGREIVWVRGKGMIFKTAQMFTRGREPLLPLTYRVFMKLGHLRLKCSYHHKISIEAQRLSA